MGADAVVIRHHASGAPQRLADAGWIAGPVINAGDGTHEHPTQALLDAFTIRQHLKRDEATLAGLKIAIVGDILHSRVARSNIFLLSMLGAEVTVIAPPTLLPVGIDSWPCFVSYNLDDSLELFDAVMALRIQRERMEQAFFPSEREYSRHYGLNGDRLARLKDGAILLHPGPMNRGVEIDAKSADSGQSVIVDQVTNGVFIRMAVLYLLLSGSPENLAEEAKG
jgi:aspartate carbamoyltransferase catalytic subunit